MYYFSKLFDTLAVELKLVNHTWVTCNFAMGWVLSHCGQTKANIDILSAEYAWYKCLFMREYDVMYQLASKMLW